MISILILASWAAEDARGQNHRPEPDRLRQEELHPEDGAIQEAVAEEAKRCGMPYVTERWLGGLLTNFVTVRRSLERRRGSSRLD